MLDSTGCCMTNLEIFSPTDTERKGRLETTAADLLWIEECEFHDDDSDTVVCNETDKELEKTPKWDPRDVIRNPPVEGISDIVSTRIALNKSNEINEISCFPTCMFTVAAVKTKPCRPEATLATNAESENHRDNEAAVENCTFNDESADAQFIPTIASKLDAVVGKLFV